MKSITVSVQAPMRINKYLSDQGIVSRRKADDLVAQHRVHVNGKPVVLGTKVVSGDVITFSVAQEEPIYALYVKPRGEVTGKVAGLPTCEPVGRLDKDSEGLLLYTNDYRVIDRLLNPKYAREKEYEVVIREKATPRVETLLRRGIHTQETEYAPVKSVHTYNEGHALRIVLTEGKKHEIRRMLNALNLTILSLRRVRIMSFVIHGLTSGKVHILTPRQKETLLRDLNLA